MPIEDNRSVRPPPLPLPAPARALRTHLLAWYDGARRALPWRALPGGRADPWAVLVSEIMLQQTTVATVGPRFAAFLARFPTPGAMAASPLDDVLHAWQGLGYYRRARGLHASAVAIADGTAAACRRRRPRSASCPASAPTPQPRWPRSRSARRSCRSTATSPASSPASSPTTPC
jgi:adenine-specific DNA glycosylase